MNSQPVVVVIALIIALLMAIKPEMFIFNPAHRTPGFTRSIKYIGMAVSIVFLVWLFFDLFLGKA